MRNKRFEFPALVGCLVSLLAAASRAQIPNTLTGNESRAGYDLLFNGSDLANWHTYRDTAVTDAWSVETDQPLGPRIENGMGSRRFPILVDKQYKNFDLKVDVMVPIKGDGGIYTRIEETALDPHSPSTGPLFKICGPYHVDCQGPFHHFGACYDMFGVNDSLRKSWANPPGTWNQVRIIAFDSNYVHYGNGKKLLEYKIGTREFEAAYADSRYRSDGNNGRYYDIHPGRFMLEHHGETGNGFRNFKAKELTVHPFLREFPDGKWPDNLPQEFVLGKRGCIDSSAANYDATAEVADSSGCHSSGLVSPDPRLAPGISVRHDGSGATSVQIPYEHADVRIRGLNGSAFAFRKTGQGLYRITRDGHSPGVAVLSFRARGRAMTRLLILR